MWAIECSGAGETSALSYNEIADAVARPGEVLLRVRATSVNRADILQRQGHYPPPPGASPILGLEAAGTVVMGAGDWEEGEQAMALLSGGGYAELVSVPPEHMLPIPRMVNPDEAGGVMEVWVTAYYNLYELGELKPHQRVLIHGGGGGVGTAAIQLARRQGAEVWVTAGSPAKLDRCLELGAQRALSYRTESFEERLRDAGGADLILDCVGAKYLERNLSALAPHGRLIVIGLQGGARGELNLGALLGRTLRVQGSTLRGLSRERKARLIERFRDRVWPLLDDGSLRPIVDRSFPLWEAAQAHEVVEQGAHFGKVLLEVR